MSYSPARTESFAGLRPRLTALATGTLLCLLVLAGCYDETSIQQLQVSPDGRWIALLTDHEEFGLMAIDQPGTLVVHSRDAHYGFSWSPDSRRVVFVERLPMEDSAIWVLNAETGQRAPRPLMVGPSWKGYPVWLSEQTVAFLSDRDSDDVNLWLVGVRDDGTPDRPFPLLDHPTDISRLWAVPGRPALIFQAMDEGRPHLWLWKPGLNTPLRLAPVLGEGYSMQQVVSFSADGNFLAFVTTDEIGRPMAAHYDIEEQKIIARLPLDRPASDLLVLSDGRIALSQGDRLLLWRPDAGLFQKSRETTDWHNAQVRALDRFGERGVVAGVAGHAFVVSHTTDDLQDRELHVRRTEDILSLAWQQARRRNYGVARRLIVELLEQSPEGTRPHYLAVTARGFLERLQGNWRQADQWLGQAAAMAPAGSTEHALAWTEQLAVRFFHWRNARLTDELLAGRAAADDESYVGAGMAAWIADLQSGGDVNLRRTWQRIGADLRQGNLESAARRLRTAFAEDDWTTMNLRGLDLLLAGSFEPLEQALERSSSALAGLMPLTDFQEVLLATLDRDRPGVATHADPRSLLLEQWVVRGDTTLARQLVREDLGRLSEDAARIYVDLLRQYLTSEERPDWIDRAVSDTLLDPNVVPRLLACLEQTEDRLAVRLAQTRRELLAGNLDRAQTHLTEAWELSALLPAESADLMRVLSERRDEYVMPAALHPTDEEAAFSRIHDLFLMELFQAKISERRNQWSEALRAYESTIYLVNRVPLDWDVTPFELVWHMGLIERGARDREALSQFLRLRNQVGDPLINPNHGGDELPLALDNLRTVEAYGADEWLLPYLAFTQGLGQSLMRRPERALFHLRRVDTLDPPTSLRMRSLLEQAALRDLLGQHALAARLYGEILRMQPPLALRAAAALAQIQSERQAGMTDDPTARLMQLMPAPTVPPAWREWLWLRVGGDINDLDLYQ